MSKQRIVISVRDGVVQAVYSSADGDTEVLVVDHDMRAKFLNHYRHEDCPEWAGSDWPEWSDEWSATCDDECPNCGAAISPYKSEDVTGDIDVQFLLPLRDLTGETKGAVERFDAGLKGE